MEDLEKFCNNCKRNVSAANFALHSAYCERNIKVCHLCNEPVPIAEENRHIEEYHIITQCDLCGEAFEKWMLSKHKEICHKRLVTCQFCELALPLDEYKEHNDFCGSRTEICITCKKYIMLRDKEKHSEEGCYKRQTTCAFCKSAFPLDEYDEHNDFCGSRTEKCLICKRYIMLRDKEEHSQFHRCGDKLYMEEIVKEEKQNILNEAISITGSNLKGSEKVLPLNDEISGSMTRKKDNVTKSNQLEDSFPGGAVAAAPDKSKEPSKHYTVCHICKQTVPWIDYNMHIPSCATALGRCSRCGEEVPSHEMKEHTFKTCSKLSRASEAAESNVNKEKSTRFYANYASQNALAEEDQSLNSCPYCKQTCSSDRILEHVKSCSENCYTCPMCSENICERDRRKHESSVCRVLYPRRVPDSYECPLCHEEIPEKNKTSHESFSCRMLMDFNQESFYPAYDASISRNVHETKNKNDFKVCSTCKENIPQNEIFRHEMLCQRSVNVPCIYCEDLILAGFENEHLNVCKKFNKSKTSKPNKREYENRDSVYQHPKFSEMVKPKIAKCKFCKTSLNADILKFHEVECIHQTVKCPDCYGNIILKDYDNHKCRSIRIRGNRGHGRQQRPEVKTESKSWLNRFNIFSSYTPKTHDQYENDRNQTYANYSNNKSVQRSNEDNDSLYFAQHFIDDPKIPCEFCGVQFPASDLVLHETGCNPEISLPKQDTSKNTKENKADSSKCNKQSYDSSISSSFFSTENRFIPTAKFESIKRNTGSGTAPGEFLSGYNAKTSSKSENHHVHQSFKRESKSSFQSVWNNDPVDVEMEEAESDVCSSDSHEKTPHGVNEYKKELSDEFNKHSIDSDEEVTNMLAFINENKSQSLSMKDDQSNTLPTNVEYLKNTSDKLLTGQNMYSHKDYCKDIYMSVKKNINLDVNQDKSSVPNEVLKEQMASFRFGNYQMADLSHRDKVGEVNLAEDDDHNHTLKLDTDLPVPKIDGDEVNESSEYMHKMPGTNAGQDELKGSKTYSFRFCDYKISSYLIEERNHDQAERDSESGISENTDNSEIKYKKAFGYIVNDTGESSDQQKRTNQMASDARIYGNKIKNLSDEPESNRRLENSKSKKSLYDQALQSLSYSTHESFNTKQLKEHSSSSRSMKKDDIEVSPHNEKKMLDAESIESESKVKKAFTIETAKYNWNPSRGSDVKIFDNDRENTESKLSKNLKTQESNFDAGYEDVEKWAKWRRKQSDSS